MQTILGGNGQIGEGLAKELNRGFTSDIRLVSRNPRKVNDTDSILSANLLDAEDADKAVKGSEIAYFTVGMPNDTATMMKQFPIILRNVITACQNRGVKLVFFDNTYMYPQNDAVLTEETKFAPFGKKGHVRAAMATMLLEEMNSGRIEAVICRAPEFYGPGKTQSITNTMIFERIRQRKEPRVLLRDDKLRTLIWTPDASRGTALVGNTSTAYGQTWHLPCDDHRLTYKQIIELASSVSGNRVQYSVLGRFQLILASVFQKSAREIQELFPRYEHNNIFDSSKFKSRFPEFSVTTYKQGIELLFNGHSC